MSHALTFLALTLIGAGAPESAKSWPLTLRQAISIGLDNDEITRRVSADSSMIAPVNAKDEPAYYCFLKEVMAEVRSIEALYWELERYHAGALTYAKAAETAEEILKAEQSTLEVSRGTVADLDKLQARVHTFQSFRSDHTIKQIAVEQRFRNFLGLPASDGRRIIPVTPPRTDFVKPDLSRCMIQMMGHQPDILALASQVELARLCLMVSRNQEIPDGTRIQLPPSMGRGPIPTVRSSQYRLLRFRESLEHTVEASTHAVFDRVWSVSDTYTRYHKHVTERDEAAKHMEKDRKYYDNGRITPDLYLDAVAKLAQREIDVADAMAEYNTALSVLEELKGTLLESWSINVVEPPQADPSARLLHFAKTPVPPPLAVKQDTQIIPSAAPAQR